MTPPDRHPEFDRRRIGNVRAEPFDPLRWEPMPSDVQQGGTADRIEEPSPVGLEGRTRSAVAFALVILAVVVVMMRTMAHETMIEREQWTRDDVREHLREERAARRDQPRHVCPKCGRRWA